LQAPFPDDKVADTVAAQRCATMKQNLTIHAHCKPGMRARQLVLQCQQHGQRSVALKHDSSSCISGQQAGTTLHSLTITLRCHVGWQIVSDDRAAADPLIEVFLILADTCDNKRMLSSSAWPVPMYVRYNHTNVRCQALHDLYISNFHHKTYAVKLSVTCTIKDMV